LKAKADKIKKEKEDQIKRLMQMDDDSEDDM
jgi:hypothetical protein